MKHLTSILAATIIFSALVSPAKAEVQVSVDFFHENLQPYGDWREIGDYGYCWQPRDVDRDWRPYSDGRWLYTDAGWTWDSEEPYAWAVYHYGRWANIDRVGWVWVPGTEWGPAWVSWRRSPKHVGWAPLPPEAEFDRSVGFNVRMDADYDIGPTSYSFVEVQNFGAPRLRTVILQPRENITIIHETTNITRVTYINNVVYNEGPRYDVISRESAQPIRRLRLERREQFDGDPRTIRSEQLRTRVDGDSFRAVAPSFDKSRATAPRKVAAKVEKVEVDRGWKNAGPPADVARARDKIKTEPAAAPEAQPQPTAEKKAEVPPPSRVPATPPRGKGAKRETDVSGDRPAPAAPAATEVSPPSPGKPVAEKPVNPKKSGRLAKPAEPQATKPEPVAPKAEAPEPPPARKIEKHAATTPIPTDLRPATKVPAVKSKSESTKSKRGLPVAPSRPKGPAGETVRPPPPERAPIQSIDRKPLPKPVPSGKLQPQAPAAKTLPAKPVPSQPPPPDQKRKGKEKDEKKDAKP